MIQTAIEISKGSIDKRVEVKRRHYGIDRLANTFKDMLDHDGYYGNRSRGQPV